MFRRGNRLENAERVFLRATGAGFSEPQVVVDPVHMFICLAELFLRGLRFPSWWLWPSTPTHGRESCRAPSLFLSSVPYASIA